MVWLKDENGRPSKAPVLSNQILNHQAAEYRC